jgi:hypothetical protein
MMDFQATTPNKSLQPTLPSVGRLSSTVGPPITVRVD